MHIPKNVLVSRYCWEIWYAAGSETPNPQPRLRLMISHPPLSPDLSELQLQSSCDAQRQGGVQHSQHGVPAFQLSREQQPAVSALTAPPRSLPGGDGALKSSKGVRARPDHVCLPHKVPVTFHCPHPPLPPPPPPPWYQQHHALPTTCYTKEQHRRLFRVIVILVAY